jgi:DNA-binding NarL/FixJ family response regulator
MQNRFATVALRDDVSVSRGIWPLADYQESGSTQSYPHAMAERIMGDDDQSESGPIPRMATGEAGRSRITASDAGRTQVTLTRRQREVVGLITEGLSNRQIAERLTLSIRTVERHTENIYDRLGCSGKVGRAIATAYAIRHGLTRPT